MTRRHAIGSLLFAFVVAWSGGPFRAAVAEQRPIELADIMAWRFINAAALSDDGAWFAYHVGPTEGEGEFVFRQTQSERELRFPAGEVGLGRPAAPVFSPDAKFGVFTVYPTRADAAQARRQRRPLQYAVAVVNLASGARNDVPRVRRYLVAPGAGGWIAMHKYAPDAPAGTPPARATDLLLRELSTGQQISIGNVSDFAFDKRGRFLAWTVDSQDKAGNGVQVRDMSTGAVRSIESDDRAVYSRMAWSDDGESLSVLKGLEDRTPGDMRYFVVGFTAFGPGGPQKTVFNPATTPGFPEGMIVSPNRAPAWTSDRSALLFGIQKATRTTPAPAVPAPSERTRDRAAGAAVPAPTAAASGSTDEKADVVVWHWQDKRLQSQQQVQETLDRNFSYLAAYRPAEKRFVRLADERLADVVAAPGGRYGIGRDDDAYELMANLDGRRFQDVYVVDLATGQRTLALTKSRWTYSASPTGTHFAFYDGGHFHTYDMRTGQSTNITKGVPTSFVDVEDDHTVEKPPTLFMGWSADGQFVLLSDDWDIWKVPVGGGPGTNLTVVGRQERVRHRRPLDFADDAGFNLGKPLYIDLYAEWTKKSGLGVIEPGKGGVRRLAFGDAAYGVPPMLKARQADVFMFTRQTHKDPADFYVTDASFASPTRITNLAAGTEQFAWSGGAMLVDYVSDKGDRLQGALFLPAGYERGKTYPMVVNIYERMSANLHAFFRMTQPNPTTLNKTLYTSQGYAVFLPDIAYKLNDPGMSAVWCVIPAVKAAIATGIVDPKRIGLMGHSWGAYQTAFLITQTDMFAAAVASAPISDWTSMYSLIYKASGGANAAIAESSQGRLTAGPWDNLATFTRNSPIPFVKNVKTPLVILHNANDGAVDFTQGVALYNSLRRLQKPVVMLEYPGETHGLARPANGKDFMTRVQQFFDHFLKGKPVPGWFKDGVPWLERQSGGAMPR